MIAYQQLVIFSGEAGLIVLDPRIAGLGANRKMASFFEAGFASVAKGRPRFAGTVAVPNSGNRLECGNVPADSGYSDP